MLPEHDGLASATFGPTVAAGLLGALLAIVPGAAAAASTGGDPPPPGDGTPPDDAPVLEPADDDDVVILDTEDQAGDPTNPGPAERDDTGDRSGVLESARLDLAGVVGVALLSFLSLALAAVSATRLRRMLHAWWSPPRATTGDPGGEPPTLSFSLIVTDGGDDEGFARTLEALAVFDHPDVEILAVVGHSESRARELAAAAYRQPQRVHVVVDRGFRRSEPRALNAGLAECRGDVVGVFRAGDEVRPGVLRHVEATLGTTGADAVQSGVLLTSGRPSWLAVRRMVESYFWFRSRLHHHAQQRFTPLATTSMFVRADVLRDAGGAIKAPSDFDVAGWFSLGPRPGQPGPAVIAGHVDSRDGPAVFYRLHELASGDEVIVRRADGTTIRFTVTGAASYAKDAFPTDSVYGPVPGPELRLITCGGQFDRSRQQYRDNVVVYAAAGPIRSIG